jgi:phenylacetate-CoA ligase
MSDPNERPYWNMEIETKLNTPAMREIQLRNLRDMLRFMYTRSGLWKRLWDRERIDVEKIETLEDFKKAFPVYTKDNLRNLLMTEYIDRLGEGLMSIAREFFCVPPEEIVLICSTSGTTGEPTPYPFTKRELEINTESLARACWRMGIRPGNLIVHAMGLSMFGAGVPVVIAMTQWGVTCIPLGAEAGSDRLLNFLRMLGLAYPQIDGMFITPSFAEYVSERCYEVIGQQASSLKVRRLICGGEPGAGIPEVRKKLEAAWNARLFDGMGLGPFAFVSCDTDVYYGMHFITEDSALLEIVDPETMESLPLEDGATGLLVMTPLKGESMTVVRHTPGDIVQVFTEPCPCGQTGMRIKMIGRTDDMLKVKGVMVYPAAIDNVITGFVPRVTGEFRIVLEEPPPRVTPPLKLKVEYGPSVRSDEERAALAKEISETMSRLIKVNPHITWVAPGSLERTAHKTRYIEKAYEKKS